MDGGASSESLLSCSSAAEDNVGDGDGDALPSTKGSGEDVGNPNSTRASAINFWVCQNCDKT